MEAKIGNGQRCIKIQISEETGKRGQGDTASGFQKCHLNLGIITFKHDIGLEAIGTANFVQKVTVIPAVVTDKRFPNQIGNGDDLFCGKGMIGPDDCDPFAGEQWSVLQNFCFWLSVIKSEIGIIGEYPVINIQICTVYLPQRHTAVGGVIGTQHFEYKIHLTAHNTQLIPAGTLSGFYGVNSGV